MLLRKARFVPAAAVFIIIYTEFLKVVLISLYWPSLQCPEGSNCIRLLYVADPQLLGEQCELYWLLRWDSDRFLKIWYSRAFLHVSPDAVIFLGDLMDEGSKALDDEFQRYTDRFFDIFPVSPHTQYLYLPGDNDIGGENGEPILVDDVNRFYRTFNNTKEMTLDKLHIIKVNVPLETSLSEHIPSKEDKIVILVSHFPLTSTGVFGMSSPAIVEKFQPHLVVSAHSHLSQLRRFAQFGASYLNSINLTRLSNSEIEELREISVPTCSYRMGVVETGYGSLLIDTTRRELTYAVLWLPHRFTDLWILGISGLIIVTYVCVRLGNVSTLRRAHLTRYWSWIEPSLLQYRAPIYANQRFGYKNLSTKLPILVS